LQREAICLANRWFNPASGISKGERAMANWDEDAVTMAVEAARDALRDFSRRPRSGQLASTSLPFHDRQNHGILPAALHLPPETASLDIVGSQRAGTSSLAAALKGKGELTLLVAAERRRTKASSSQELNYGDGAAALVIGDDNAIATCLASYGETV